jgi:hypothetical protein
MGACVASYGLLGDSEGYESTRKGRGTDVEPQPSRTQDRVLLFLTAELLARPSGFAACPQGRYQRGPAAALPLRCPKVPAADQIVLKKVWASLTQEPLQEKLAKALPEECHQRNLLTVAESLKGSLVVVVVGCCYSHFEHHRESWGTYYSFARYCYCHQ